MKFIKAKAFEIIITLLLTVLTGIGLYFVRKIESCELRIWTLETSSPTVMERFKTLEAKIDGVNGRIDVVKDLVLRLLSKPAARTSHVGEREPSHLPESLAEHSGGSP